MTTTLTITSGQTSFTAQNYVILPSPGTAVPDSVAPLILAAAQYAGVVLSSSAGTGVITVPSRRFNRSGVGPPVAGEGSWLLGDEVVDSNNDEWECTAPGNPGAWKTALSGTFAQLRQIPLYGAEGYRVLTIVVYHVIASSTAFNSELDLYRQWNYTTVDPDQVYNWMQGTGTLPDKPLLITFDDGYATQYANAWPGLQARNMKATMYVTTAWVDGTESQGTGSFLEATPITWAQLNTMYASGLIRVQSHTVSHQNLTGLTQSQVQTDFTTAKARIESQVSGETCWHVAYPYSAFSPTVQAGLAAAGVHTARAIQINPDGSYAGSTNQTKNEFCTLFHPRLALPCAGSGSAMVQQANSLRKVTRDEEFIPDYAFTSASNPPLGWTVGTGFSIETGTGPAGENVLVSVQQTSSVSAKTTDPLPCGQYAAFFWSVWLKITGSMSGGSVKLTINALKYDGTTVGSTSDVFSGVSSTTGNGWQQFTGLFYGDKNTFFVQPILVTLGAGTPVGTVRFADFSLKRAVHPPALPWV